jgi:tetratricopeptide (TPR) repeat protein
MKYPRVHLIEITNFDEFMACLHKCSNVNLPDCLTQPYKVAETRVDSLMDMPATLKDNPIIIEDTSKIIDGLRNINNYVQISNTNEKLKPNEIVLNTSVLPPSVQGMLLRDQGNLEGALEKYKIALENDKENSGIASEIAKILALLGRTEELKQFVEFNPVVSYNKTYYLLFAKDDKFLIKFASKQIEEDPSNIVARINRAIAYKRLHRPLLLKRDLEEIERRNPGTPVLAGVAALRKDKDKLLEYLNLSLEKHEISIAQIREFPVFEDFRKDSEFNNFLIEKERI